MKQSGVGRGEDRAERCPDHTGSKPEATQTPVKCLQSFRRDWCDPFVLQQHNHWMQSGFKAGSREAESLKPGGGLFFSRMN